MYTNRSYVFAISMNVSDQPNNKRKSTLTLASTDEMVHNTKYCISLIENFVKQ